LTIIDEKVSHTEIFKTQIKLYKCNWLIDILLQHLILINSQNIIIFYDFTTTSIRSTQSCFVTNQLHMMKIDIIKNVERHQTNFTKFNNTLFMSLSIQPLDGSYQRLNVAHIVNFIFLNQSATLIKTRGIFTNDQATEIETLKPIINKISKK